MKLEQIYTTCIAHAAYYIESNGEAALVDPLREVQPYLDRADKDGAKVKYVFETHFHADFVSGHLDLAKKTGAQIVYGPTAAPAFEAVIAEDGQEFKVGGVTIRAIHTPGHTMESTTYLVIDEEGKEHGILTGDTLFIGDVGRPDLAQHVIADLTEEKLAKQLFHSLRNKIMPLSDDLIVYPNHGAGSACGKKMSKETTDTLGNQKKTNYALNPDLSEAEFIEQLMDGLTTPPGYFPKNVVMNKGGYEELDSIIERASKPLNPTEFELVAEETNALILDTRNAEDFAKGFIPNSLNIGLSGSFAMWVGEMIADIKQEILLVTDEGKEEEAMIRLSRVGYDQTVGFLKGGFEAWKADGKAVDHLTRISPEEFAGMYSSDAQIFDVRKKSEFDSEHVEGAVNTPLNQILDHLSKFPKEGNFIVHCAGGYRSMVAASILKQNGFNNFEEVRGGFKGISEAGVPTTDYVAPTTLL